MSRWSRPLSARTRILGAILTVAFVGLVVVGGVTLVAQRDRVLADVDDRLNGQIAGIFSDGGVTDVQPSPSTDPAESPFATEEYDTVSDFLQSAVSRSTPGRNGAAVAVIDGEARFIPDAVTGFDISEDPQLIDQVLARTEPGGPPVLGTADTDAGTFRYIGVPVTVAGDDSDGVYIGAIDLGVELAPVRDSTITFAAAALLTLLAIGVVGWFVVGRLLTPIRQLRETADAITLADLGARIPTAGNDDISDVTRTINSMLDRLEGSVDVQRQLLDDVRHELKTPITIVRGHLEMMDMADAADVASTREIGIAELDRMTRLVDDIDMLAAVEGEPFALLPEDVAGLTARVGDLVGAIPGHPWSIEAVGQGTVEANSDRVVQAWIQLADNAAKYTPQGSPIEIGSSVDEIGARLWVRDHGPGIPPASRHRIFRRFDRAQGRRSVGGSGLGLAIVDAITKGHGGHCSVTDTPGGGVTFTIHLPIRQGAPAAELPAPVRAGDVVMQREATG